MWTNLRTMVTFGESRKGIQGKRVLPRALQLIWAMFGLMGGRSHTSIYCSFNLLMCKIYGNFKNRKGRRRKIFLDQLLHWGNQKLLEMTPSCPSLVRNPDGGHPSQFSPDSCLVQGSRHCTSPLPDGHHWRVKLHSLWLFLESHLTWIPPEHVC